MSCKPRRQFGALALGITWLLLAPGCSDESGAGAEAPVNATDGTAPQESGSPGPVDANGGSPTDSSSALDPADPASDVDDPPAAAVGGASGTGAPSDTGGSNTSPPNDDPNESSGGNPASEPSEPDAPPATPDDEDPSASSGCGNASPPEGPLTLDVDGTERSYIVSLPEGYDPATPYPLVFAFHGLGGSGELVSNRFYFGIEQTGGRPSLFVYPDGLDTGMGAGWANSDGQDVAFFDRLLETLQQNYCVDSTRVFSTGHSYGGMMTHTLACERPEVLRAIAPVAGAHFGFGGGGCSGPVAAWGAHGDPDDTVAYESGLSAIERVMETNGCDPSSGVATAPDEYCTLYSCDEGYPVTWCVHGQNHDWPDFAAQSIKDFFDSF